MTRANIRNGKHDDPCAYMVKSAFDGSVYFKRCGDDFLADKEVGDGDVALCVHGQIWMAERYYPHRRVRRLDPIMTPFKYRRAVRALGTADTSSVIEFGAAVRKKGDEAVSLDEVLEENYD